MRAHATKVLLTGAIIFLVLGLISVAIIFFTNPTSAPPAPTPRIPEKQGKELRGDFNHLRRDFNDLRREVRDLARTFERPAYEIHRVSESEAQERRMIPIELENTLLKFERRLPGKSSPTEQED